MRKFLQGDPKLMTNFCFLVIFCELSPFVAFSVLIFFLSKKYRWSLKANDSDLQQFCAQLQRFRRSRHVSDFDQIEQADHSFLSSIDIS